MKKRVSLTLMAGLLVSPAIKPQALSGHMEYATELQATTKASNWANLLQLHGRLELTPALAVEARTISVVSTHGAGLIDDFQLYSNIQEDNLTLAPALLDARWTSPGGATETTLGVHNVNDDFFTSPGTGLFTNSSCGIFPTLSANYDIANYPKASVAAGVRHRRGPLELLVYVYNGKGYNRFSGRDNVFRVCPRTDGIFGITSINYSKANGTYNLGLALYHGVLSHDEVAGAAPETQAQKATSLTPWCNIEQPLGKGWQVILQASVCTSSQAQCRHYEAVGATFTVGKAEIGVIANNTSVAGVRENALEATSRLTVSDTVYLQPALHVVRTGGDTAVVGLMRLGIDLDL